MKPSAKNDVACLQIGHIEVLSRRFAPGSDLWS
jgi:hypothetical protein